ncbi:MAG TPA: hypothetical protein VJ837_05185, partial [Candidatus Paceibacterota bacterium]|nr:hypothetical protein [Candidatus Paceibacterota bacterium]
MFTWVPIHKEAVRRILSFSEPQQELLAVLREMEQQGLKVISLDDKSAEGRVPLAEIDPFSFFASFNRGITEDNRKEDWRFLKKRWDLRSSVPDDFAGIPVLHNMKSWFFPYVKSRDKNHMDVLWQVFRQAADNPVEQIDRALFERCIALPQITTNKLTIGLFWVNPDAYLPADRKTKAFVEEKGVTEKPNDHDSYRRWLEEVRAKVGIDYPKISHDAHVWATEEGEDNGDDDDEDVKPTPARRLWVVAPGSKASEWQTFYNAGIIGIGWENLTDLREYKDKEAIRKKLQESEGDSSKVNDTLACWQFAHVMRPGDILFAKKGLKKVVGYGTVTGDYEYDPSRGWYKHVRSVQWLANGVWHLPEGEQLPAKTLTNVTKDQNLVDTLTKLVGLDLGSIGKATPQPGSKRADQHVSYWWLNANPKQWSFEQAAVGTKQTYTSHNENG